MNADGPTRFYRLQADSHLKSNRIALPDHLRLSRWRPGTDGWPTGLFATNANRLWTVLGKAGAFPRDDLTVYAIHNGDRLVHRMLVTPRWYRFPFMGANDLQLGDLWTAPDQRGAGLAGFAARAVHADFADVCDAFWYLVPENNLSSIRLVERLNYEYVGRGIRTRRLGLSLLGQFKPIPTAIAENG